MTPSSGRRLLPALVAVATFAAFQPALDAGFLNWDDGVNILTNEAYRGLGWANLKWMFTSTLLAVYAPLAWLTLGLNYALGGMDPWGYHLGNLLIHAANAGLFYLVATRLLAAALPPGPGDGSPPGDATIALGAALAALAFGVHPLRVESVAWVTERRDVLCGSFYLLAVLGYLRGAAGGGLVGGRWLAVSLLAFAAALLSKGIAMTLPLTLLLLDVYPLRRLGLGWRALTLEKIPYAVLAGLGAGVAVFAVGQGSTWTGYETYGLPARAAMVGYSLWFYPWKMLWPEGLSPLYELPALVDPLAPRFLGPLAAAAVVTAVLVRLRRRCPGALAAWVHSAIVLAPVSGVVHAGNQLAHDRFSYLSGLGFAVLVGAAGAWVLRAQERGRVRGSIAVLVVLAAALTLFGWGWGAWRQSTLWRDSETLWRAAIDTDGHCAICHNNLAAAIIRSESPGRARLMEAEAHLRQAIALRPERPDPYLNLGALLAGQARYGETEPLLRAYARLTLGLAEGPARLGMLRVDQGRFGEALPLLRQALRIEPRHRLARADLARALAAVAADRRRQGQLDEALALVREATALRPDSPEALSAMGQTLVELGRAAEALGPLERAAALAPRSATARFWLGRAYLLAGERARAEAEIDALRGLDAALAARVRE